MRKKTFFTKIAALALSAAMLAGSALAVSAADLTIDSTHQGTLQIKKLQSGDQALPIEGVKFQYGKVGSFEQVSVEADGDGNTNSIKSVTGFSFDTAAAELETILSDESKVGSDKKIEPITTTDQGTKIYDGKKIQEAFDALFNTANAEQDQTTVKALASTVFDATGSDGLTNKVNVEHGLYLVVETEAPSEVVELHKPFLVSVPIWGTVTEGDQSSEGWVYDVIAQPKNDYISEVPEPEKTMDGNADNLSAAIGDEHVFTISSTVPEGSLEKFVFADTMSDGLTYVGELTVVGKDSNGTDVPLTSGTEYTVTAEPQTQTGGSLEITFDVAEIKDYTQIIATYKAKLNEKAFIDVSGTGNMDNKNTFEVLYSNNPTAEKPIKEVTIDTYGFTLAKKNEEDQNLAGVTFKLYKEVTNNGVTEFKPVSFYTAIDANSGTVTGSLVSENTTASNGILDFYGLEKGTYYLEETKTAEGYNLLKERVKITVDENTTLNGVDITIVNTKGFTLPETGGMGTILITVFGVIMVCGAGVLLAAYSRKNKGNKA